MGEIYGWSEERLRVAEFLIILPDLMSLRAGYKFCFGEASTRWCCSDTLQVGRCRSNWWGWLIAVIVSVEKTWKLGP